MTQAEEVAYHQGYAAGSEGGSKYDYPYSNAGLKAAWEDGFEEGNWQALDRLRYF